MTQKDFFSGSVSLGQNHGGLNTSSSLIYNRAGNFCKSSFKHKKCNGSSTIFIIEKSLILLARVISCTLKPQYNEPRYSEFRDIY